MPLLVDTYTGQIRLPKTGLADYGPPINPAFVGPLTVQHAVDPRSPLHIPPDVQVSSDPLIDAFVRIPGQVNQAVRDELTGVVGGAPGPVITSAEESALKKVIGQAAVGPLKVANWLLFSGRADPGGSAELSPFDQSRRPQIRPADLTRFTDQALLKVITSTAARPTLNPTTLNLQRAAAEELARRQAIREQQQLAQLVGVNALAGLISGSSRPAPVLDGGSQLRHEQAVEVLEEARALGQIVGTVVFPGWASDP